MKLLLDTHIWLWSLIDPSLLSPKLIKELIDTVNEIWLSPISVWEACLLVNKRRIVVEGPPEAWIRQALRRAPIKEARMNHEIAMQSLAMQLPHGDPADRFIAATAVVYDLTLVTADERLLKCPQLRTMCHR